MAFLKNAALENPGDLPLLGVQDKMNEKSNNNKKTLITSKTRCLFVEKLNNKV